MNRFSFFSAFRFSLFHSHIIISVCVCVRRFLIHLQQTRPTLLGSCNCDELKPIQCHLETKDLWEKFHELGTEMIITKTGRYVYATWTLFAIFFIHSFNLFIPLDKMNIEQHFLFEIFNSSISNRLNIRSGFLLILINYLIGESINAISVNVRVRLRFCAWCFCISHAASACKRANEQYEKRNCDLV